MYVTMYVFSLYLSRYLAMYLCKYVCICVARFQMCMVSIKECLKSTLVKLNLENSSNRFSNKSNQCIKYVILQLVCGTIYLYWTCHVQINLQCNVVHFPWSNTLWRFFFWYAMAHYRVNMVETTWRLLLTMWCTELGWKQPGGLYWPGDVHSWVETTWGPFLTICTELGWKQLGGGALLTMWCTELGWKQLGILYWPCDVQRWGCQHRLGGSFTGTWERSTV